MEQASGAIVILDYGSQYTQLIARRIRELAVFSVILPWNADAEAIRAHAPLGVILSGGPASVYEDGAPALNEAALGLGVPVLGICYGMQLMGRALGASIERSDRREYGLAELHCDVSAPLMEGLDPQEPVWMSHGDSVHTLPAGARALARSSGSPVCAFALAERGLYGLQFHPEVSHTVHGTQILRNFVFGICGAAADWTREQFIDSTVARVRETVGDARVFCAVSGGVDSTVLAALLSRALHRQVECVFIDTGLLRKHEGDEVVSLFARHMDVSFHRVDAGPEFMAALAGVDDPEAKRKAIGHTFIRVFERVSAELGEMPYLAQGTLYPDVIESVSVGGPSATIKSHHNVGGLPEDMRFTLVEPLRELFKDEVREVGAALGLPRDFLMRHPFPGPGLAVRILGEVTADKVAVLQEADAIFIDELRAGGWYDKVWQALAVLLPVRSVGVMGDFRTYENVVALRAVDSLDGMTARWSELPHGLLERVSNRIIGSVRGVNRVVYDISSKPPATIEWE
ncbi:MAG: glutamine-hydrolyzing GMP synthase [Candidatus Krumholzibacteriia bacterium]|nr:glutamine-hydrolyzing GMP synthase [Candidatus Latescibacterota bacterium]